MPLGMVDILFYCLLDVYKRQIKVYARTTDAYVEISVEDNGRGISEEDVARIIGEKVYDSRVIAVSYTHLDVYKRQAVKMGYTTITRNHPDYLKLRVLMTLFGGYFGSRLMSNIREEKGYTYGCLLYTSSLLRIMMRN